MLDFARLARLYVREFELSDSNLENRIIKISDAQNLHVNMLDFALITICRWKTHIVYKIALLKRS